MPKSFSEAEKAFIRERLMQEAEDSLTLYGIRRTTVDELVRRVKIPKGTFYLFYESKEALIFDVLLKYNTEIQKSIIKQVSAMQEKPNAEELTEIILGFYKSLDGSFLLKLVENGELELLMQKAPPEFVKTNILDDNMLTGRLMALFPAMDTANSALFSAALRGAFLLLLHKKDIAYERFDELLRVIIRGILIQMFGGQI